MGEIIKNITISILVVIAIMLLIITFSYNKISLSRVVPKVELYQLDDEIKQEVEQEEENEQTEIVTTYELDATDLNYYEKTKEYDKGKKNPFAPEPTENSSSSGNQSEGGNSSSSDDDNGETEKKSSSTNFYEDDGTK